MTDLEIDITIQKGKLYRMRAESGVDLTDGVIFRFNGEFTGLANANSSPRNAVVIKTGNDTIFPVVN